MIDMISNQKGFAAIALILIAVFALAIFVLPIHAEYADPEKKKCDGNALVTYQVIRFDNGNVKEERELSRENCGQNFRVCPSGVAVAQKTCVQSGGTASCNNPQPACTSGPATTGADKEEFDVFTKKQLVLELLPASATKEAGGKVQFTLKIKNQNRVALTAELAAVAVPNGITIKDMPATVSVPRKNNNRDGESRPVQFEVESSEALATGTYTVKINVHVTEHSLNLFSTANASFVVAQRGVPDIEFDPPGSGTRTGIPGQEVTYTVKATNTDPAGFDSSRITVRANAPSGWSASVNPANKDLAPGESFVFEVEVESPETITEEISELIEISASSSRISGQSSVNAVYNIELCGDKICQSEESDKTGTGFCPGDCPNSVTVSEYAGADTNMFCFAGSTDNYRCEVDADDGTALGEPGDTGAAFSVGPSELSPQVFIACARSATMSQCKSAFDAGNCGFDFNTGNFKPCLCGSGPGTPPEERKRCSMRCADKDGVYYIYIRGSASGSEMRTIGNYSFSCPFVDLPDLLELQRTYESRVAALQQARDGYLQELQSPTIGSDRGDSQVCYDSHVAAVDAASKYVAHLTKVKNTPAVSNTTEARAMAEVVDSTITAQLALCGPFTGFLKIESMLPPQPTEINTAATGSVLVRNTANIGYYGYTECTITSPGGAVSVRKSDCTFMPPGEVRELQPSVTPDEKGRWSMQCSAYGAFDPACTAPSRHDIKSVQQFSVFTKEASVTTASQSCSAQGIVNCSVATDSPFQCAGCRITTPSGTADCTFDNHVETQSGSVSNFTCGIHTPGRYNLTAYIIQSPDCIPFAPAEANLTAACAGCGDGVRQGSEQCEPPDSESVQQAVTGCETSSAGQRTGRAWSRPDAFGFCTPSCLVSLDPVSYSCSLACGAECTDGTTRNRTHTTPYGTCTYVEQCDAGCRWFAPALCEPAINVSRAIFTLSHDPTHPATGTPVTIAATTSDPRGLTDVSIYVDGSLATSCTSVPCSTSPVQYGRGTHKYNATVRDVEGNARYTENTFYVADPTDPTASLTVTAINPPLDDVVNITVSASDTGGAGLKSIRITVDSLVVACTSSACSVQRRYGVGTHSYSALVLDNDDNSFTESGTFTVEDGTAPSVTVSHSPAVARSGQDVTISAVASEAQSSMARIEIYINDTLVHTCASTAACIKPQVRLPSGSHVYYAKAVDAAGNEQDSEAKSIIVNDPPNVTDISYTGSCVSGSTITVRCTVNDVDNDGLTVRASAGTCGSDCAATRTTSYLNNFVMNPGGGVYTASIPISQQTGTGVAFSCSADDTRYVSSRSKYPLCIVDGCTSVPGFFGIRAEPDPANSSTTITFASDADLPADPTVTVKPGGVGTGAPAAVVSKSGRTYTYRFTITSGMTNGPATVTVKGSDASGCAGSSEGSFVIDTQPPSLSASHVVDNSSGIIVNVTASSTAADIKSIRMIVDGNATECIQSSCTVSDIYSYGTHSYYAAAEDNAGNTARTAAATFRVPDQIKPIVVAVHAPRNATDDRNATITATAVDSGGSGLRTVEIYVNGVRSWSCTSSPCSYARVFSAGVYNYSAVAADTEGNTQTSESRLLIVAKPSAAVSYPLPPNVTAPPPPVFTGVCPLSFTSACVHDAGTNRFNATMNITRNSTLGDHFHGQIGGTPSPKMYSSSSYRLVLSASGVVKFEALLHEVNDTPICSVSMDVLCAPGASLQADDVSVVKNAPSSARTGSVPVGINISSSSTIKNFKFTENVPAGVPLSSIRVTGNNSIVRMSGPSNVTINSTQYSAYDFVTDLDPGERIEVSYTANIGRDGEYNFLSQTDANGRVTTQSKKMTATSCAQTGTAYAVDAAGKCVPFKDSCSVPAGYTIVSTCAGQQREEQINWIILIPIAIVAGAGAYYAYKNRDKIKEMLSGGKEKKILKKLQEAAER